MSRSGRAGAVQNRSGAERYGMGSDVRTTTGFFFLGLTENSLNMAQSFFFKQNAAKYFSSSKLLFFVVSSSKVELFLFVVSSSKKFIFFFFKICRISIFADFFSRSLIQAEDSRNAVGRQMYYCFLKIKRQSQI